MLAVLRRKKIILTKSRYLYTYISRHDEPNIPSMYKWAQCADTYIGCACACDDMTENVQYEKIDFF